MLFEFLLQAWTDGSRPSPRVESRQGYSSALWRSAREDVSSKDLDDGRVIPRGVHGEAFEGV